MLEVLATNIGSRASNKAHGTCVIVRDGFGNALCVAYETAENVTHVARIDDGDFAQVLENLGIPHKCAVSPIALPDVPSNFRRILP